MLMQTSVWDIYFALIIALSFLFVARLLLIEHLKISKFFWHNTCLYTHSINFFKAKTIA